MYNFFLTSEGGPRTTLTCQKEIIYGKKIYIKIYFKIIYFGTTLI